MIGVNQGLWIGTCWVQGSLLEHIKLCLESPMEVTTGNKPGGGGVVSKGWEF